MTCWLLCQGSGAVPSSEAADITMQICDALSDLHKWNIIVRDLKPNNILYDERGRHFVGDFGMSVKMQVCLSLRCPWLIDRKPSPGHEPCAVEPQGPGGDIPVHG